MHNPENLKLWLEVPTESTLDFTDDYYSVLIQEAANTVWKMKYLKGEMSLEQLRIKEVELLNG